ncbi:MAG: hypothetical protein IPL22_12880 [Bacteroidetes bacterium]|nr:hypothetical protein [Bacteroidota bacterium]
MQHSFDIFPPSVYAIKFYYPATTSFSVNDASTVFADNEHSGGLFLAKDGGPFTLTGQVEIPETSLWLRSMFPEGY